MKKKTSAPTKVLLDTADDMRTAGILDVKAHEKITKRTKMSRAANLTATRAPARPASGSPR
jgi:hypothetical protein